jgi:hypothetical protein
MTKTETDNRRLALQEACRYAREKRFDANVNIIEKAREFLEFLQGRKEKDIGEL